MSNNGLYLYEKENLGGTFLDVKQPISNINNGSGQITNSISVMSGGWDIYSDTNYKGKLNATKLTATGGPAGNGIYYTPSDWGGSDNDVVKSVMC